MRRRVATALVCLSLAGIVLTEAGHGLIATKALLEELRKANVNTEWITAAKAIWILVSVDLTFFAALVMVTFFRTNPVPSRALANAIALLLLAESGYLFVELDVFPGAVLMSTSGVTLLLAAQLFWPQKNRIQ
jgi:hypothetical protein